MATPAPKPDNRDPARSVRLNDVLWAKFRRIGGAQWLRKAIERAKEPQQ